MKKKLAGLLTVLMVLSMGMTAFAKESPGKGNSSNSSGSSSTTTQTPTGTGKTETTPVSQAVKEAAFEVAKVVSPNAQVMAVVDVTYDGEIPAGGVELSFSLAGVQAGDNIVLLHQLKDGRWEKITPDSIENGVVKATFTSLSPVAFVKIPPAQNDGNTASNGTANGTNGTTNGTSAKPNGTTTSTSSNAVGSVAASPKTGAALPVLPVLVMICAAGIVVCGRKVKFND